MKGKNIIAHPIFLILIVRRSEDLEFYYAWDDITFDKSNKKFSVRRNPSRAIISLDG